ncbi:DNA gyrase inhibitor YacG [Methyloceanibacter sp. wino2]|uniref:DNA gyrase inhibitor YacG n=1 Tax=Methyloceanibacter sp. wino2 TaxID=2170729 RepID=UPI000D3E6D63|nr:DNA gyrase inhibitor YacG [Methyloceanibacter sp. wino2]
MTAGRDSKAAQKAVARCPICRKPTVKAHRPFCSKRCAELDLGRWLKGAYAVPGDPAEEAYPEPPAGWDED